MAAYGEPFQQFDSGEPPMGRMGGMDGGPPEPPQSRTGQTLGLASGRQNEGDTLQSATASMLHEIYHEYKDPELGIVIGEMTDLEPIPQMKRKVKEAPKLQRAAAPPPRAPPQICGIGLKIADDPPHKIMAVNKLKDANDTDINKKITKGDILEQVDDTYVDEMHIDELENLIFGPKGSICELVLRKAKGNEMYKVACKRHIPIMFALGMSITTESPHKVTRVDDLRDENNNICNHLVTVGHYVEYLDGIHVEELPMQRLEAIIFGHLNSTLIMTFKDPGTGQTYDVRLMRHVPVASWLRWEDQGGKTGPPSTNQATLDAFPASVPFDPTAPPPPGIGSAGYMSGPPLPPIGGGSAGYMPGPGSAGYMPGPAYPPVPSNYPPPSQAPSLMSGTVYANAPAPPGQDVVGEFI